MNGIISSYIRIGISWFKKNFFVIKMFDYSVWNSCVYSWYKYYVFFSIFNSFMDSIWNFLCFISIEINMIIFVFNNNKCCEMEMMFIFNYFSNMVDCNNVFF